MMCPEGDMYVRPRRDPNYLDSYMLDMSAKIAHYVGNYWFCNADLPAMRDRRLVKVPLPEDYTVCRFCILEEMAT
jgi:hypothetical protein